ncbi:MAG: glycoside hydrolase family 32 protein, partial [Bacteroidota bacterium]
MKDIGRITLLCLLVACNNAEQKKEAANSLTNTDSSYAEQHRPQIHFSPKANWMNDPNGMVFLNGTWHLFYQYYPDSTVWGPMHWAHATSKNLVQWEHQPTALFPDSLGYIFSGSCVVDSNNSSGFGKDGKPPLIAIFTHHDTTGEKAGTSTFQNQRIAYSLDEGKTWTKYPANPVLKNPGIRDFRDPKVMWYAPAKKWIMTLATKDRISFYSSPDLKTWSKESEFGATIGAHGGVWECPDLFSMEHEGTQIWVLLVSINPGGPNGGSATQYFTGTFDGKTFMPNNVQTKWLDYGTDNYAGVTWSNTGKRKIFMGWMSNWQYAMMVPTEKWRSAMTVPRELGIEKLGKQFFVTSKPVDELKALTTEEKLLQNIDAASFNLSEITGELGGGAKLKMSFDTAKSFSLVLFNDKGEELAAGFDKATNTYFIDRTKAGKKDFEKGFAKKHFAPRIGNKTSMEITFVIDDASIEMFADDGLTVMTDI